MIPLFVKGKQLKIQSNPLGFGGEAEVYLVDPSLVAKIFYLPTANKKDPENIAKTHKLALHQEKLPKYPKGLPAQIVGPIDLVKDKNDMIVGYTMRFLPQMPLWVQYVNPSNRITDRLNNEITTTLKSLYETVKILHDKGVVIGDFNDMNIMVDQPRHQVNMVDTDSYQWDKYPCDTFTQKFVDPLLCVKDPNSNSLMINKNHNKMSDWYAFNIMWMEGLTFGGPYSGIYKPADTKKQIPAGLRPLSRITLFHQEVKRPKFILSDNLLPDDLLHHFYNCFVKDARNVPDKSLLENTVWQSCTNCGTYHARSTCPQCSQHNKLPKTITAIVHGKVIVNIHLQTTGHVLYAAIQNGVLCYIVHENGEFKRESKKKGNDRRDYTA